ncbi:MAG TPA: Imm8 family immunity protein [Gemmatimonadales bacterium]|nr:Imm8 family immunity protein [Gemmatimonadales bacterium]
MIYPELRHLLSPDLAPPTMPADPTDCAVPFQALIGPRGGEGAEAFGFTAVTPAYLRRSIGPTWGRGYLILEEFSWETMTHALALLLAHCVRPTWEEVAAELNKELHWEFDNHRVAQA